MEKSLTRNPRKDFTFFQKFGHTGRAWSPPYADPYADFHPFGGTAVLPDTLSPTSYADFFIRVKILVVTAVQ